jgi:hypothetical protein
LFHRLVLLQVLILMLAQFMFMEENNEVFGKNC